MIRKCNSDKCRTGHSQDTIHGDGLRVMNPTKDPEVFRCTVCSTPTRIEKKGTTSEPIKQSGKKAA